MTVVLLHVEGDEWWLKHEWQEEHETREEWKARTFAMRYGRRMTKINQATTVSAEEAAVAAREFSCLYDLKENPE